MGPPHGLLWEREHAIVEPCAISRWRADRRVVGGDLMGGHVMKPGSIVAISAGPVRLARVLSIDGSRATLRTLDTDRTIVRPVGMLWAVLDPI